MPTEIQFRTARTLLGLTQSQVSVRMGISKQALKNMENDNKRNPQRNYVQYYDLWLREYARRVKPEALDTVETILTNEGFTRMFHIVEPNAHPGRPRKTRINELDKTFSSTSDLAKWLVNKGFTDACKDHVAQRVRNAASGTGPKRYLGFTYSYVDDGKTDIDTTGMEIDDFESGIEIVELGKRFDNIRNAAIWIRHEKEILDCSVPTITRRIRQVLDISDKSYQGYTFRSF